MKVENNRVRLEEEATEASEIAEKVLMRIEELHNLLKTKEAKIQLQREEMKKMLDSLTNQDASARNKRLAKLQRESLDRYDVWIKNFIQIY